MRAMPGLCALLMAAAFCCGYTFERTYGTTAREWGVGIAALGDSGFLIAAGIEQDTGSAGILLMRINARGDELWARTILEPGVSLVPMGMSGDDSGGCLVVGSRQADRPDWDMLAIRFASNGDTVWSATWGTEGYSEEATSVCRTADGWVVGGYTLENGAPDVRLDRLSDSGAVLWSRVTGTGQPDLVWSVCRTWDGAFIAAGSTYPDGSRFSNGYLVKVGDSGDVRWTRSFGDSLWDEVRTVVETHEHNIVVAGFSSSYSTSMDAYLFAMDSTGQGLWHRTFGFEGSDRAFSLCQAGDGGFLLAGESYPLGNGSSDMYLVRTDPQGLIQWQRLYGHTGDDRAAAALCLLDSGFCVAGTSLDSLNGSDVYVARTNSQGTIALTDVGSAGPYRLLARPNPFKTDVSLQLAACSRTDVCVVDASGRVVRSLPVFHSLLPTPYSLVWDGRDAGGSVVPAGIYYLELPGQGRAKVAKAD